jgi:iron complex outermembrane receptor protein
LPAGALGAVISSSACAQAADDAALQLPAITVTAEKRARALEDVPASIAVINGWDIEQSGIIGMEQLEGRVPGLSFQPFGQAGMNSPVMRGLTANFNTFSTSTLLLVDGVPTLTAQGFENGFLDLDRIEVLRGPQSTLYGRNAEAGVIALHSQPMDNTPRASITGEIGSRDRRALRFALSRPVVEDKLYASISGSWFAQDGFIDNT